MKPTRKKIRLQLLPLQRYVGVDEKDPIKFYRLPVIGRMYQQRMVDLGPAPLPSLVMSLFQFHQLDRKSTR